MTDVLRSPSESRYEIAILVGPCRESEAEDFLIAVMDFANQYRTWAGRGLGPAGAVGPWDVGDDD